MKKFSVKAIRTFMTFIAVILFSFMYFSCAGGEGGADSSSESLALNITTSRGRAASLVSYDFTVRITGSSYSIEKMKSGNPVTFYFDDIPTEETLDINVLVKLGSLLVYTGNKTTSIDAGDSEITIDLSSNLEDTLNVSSGDICNLRTLISKSTAETPTVILKEDCSNSDITDAIGQISSSGKNVNLNLMNVQKTSYSSTDISEFNSCSYLTLVQLANNSTLDGVSSKIACSSPTIKLPSEGYANTVLMIENNSNLTNVTLDYDSKYTTVSKIGTLPTRVTGLKLTGVKTISDDAFKGWEGLKNSTVTIPASVTKINQHAFAVGGGDDTGSLKLNFEVTSGWKKDLGNGSWADYTMSSPQPASSIVYYGFKRE
ncbi:MAG: hypothetical protein K6G00_06955 [Treponema sp.]|nr:hypothetical protein [Treponema sp.]